MSKIRYGAIAFLIVFAMSLYSCLADEPLPLEITTEANTEHSDSLETLPVYELDTETEALPGTTQVETTDNFEEIISPETTSTPETTSAPETTSVPETTSAPETTTATITTSVPETTASIKQDQTVYWVQNGEVWHTTLECPSLSRSKNILSGSIDDAMASGKARVCKRCG